MKHLTIIVPEGQNNLSSIVGPYKIFTRANEYRKQAGRKSVFNIELAGVSYSGKLPEYHPWNTGTNTTKK